MVRTSLPLIKITILTVYLALQLVGFNLHKDLLIEIKSAKIILVHPKGKIKFGTRPKCFFFLRHFPSISYLLLYLFAMTTRSDNFCHLKFGSNKHMGSNIEKSDIEISTLEKKI